MTSASGSTNTTASRAVGVKVPADQPVYARSTVYNAERLKVLVENVGFCCRLVIAGVFGLSSVGKLRNFSNFAGSLSGFGVYSRRAQQYIASVVLACEGLILCGMLIPVAVIGGFLLAVVLLLAFSFKIYQIVKSAHTVRCQCFGSASEELKLMHVLRNIFLAVLALSGAACVSISPGIPLLPAASAAVVAAVIIVCLVTHLDDLVQVVGSQS